MKLCNLEIAKALHELGYDGEYQYCHVNACDEGYETLTTAECKEYESDIDNQCPAPRLDDAAYFLREKYDIFVEIVLDCYSPNKYFTTLTKASTGYYIRQMHQPADYETALETGLKQAIEIIKKKGQ